MLFKRYIIYFRNLNDEDHLDDGLGYTGDITWDLLAIKLNFSSRCFLCLLNGYFKLFLSSLNTSAKYCITEAFFHRFEVCSSHTC